MKIIDIFATEFPGHLYAVVWDEINSFDSVMNNWTSVSFLRRFAKDNKILDVYAFIQKITKEVASIDNLFIRYVQQKGNIDNYFRPLSNSEYLDKVLSLQKGKINTQMLRIYAIKIESNCYIITGGAIKLTRTMQEHRDTLIELQKLNKLKNFLINEGILDKDSIEEYVLEIN